MCREQQSSTTSIRSDVCSCCDVRATCEHRIPELLPECRDVAALWQAAGTQWRVGFGGLVGLDFMAVGAIGRWIGIDIRQPRIFLGLALLEHLELKQQEENRKK